MIPLTGYTDRFSVRAGEAVEVKVSSSFSDDFHSELVRIYSADPNPAGPGFDITPVDAPFTDYYKSVYKPSNPGSYGTVQIGELQTGSETTFLLRFKPYLLHNERQCLFSILLKDGAAVTVSLIGNELYLRAGDEEQRVRAELRSHTWHELRLALSPAGLDLGVYLVERREMRATCHVDGSWTLNECQTLFLAADHVEKEDGQEATAYFNGRLEDPAFVNGIRMPACLYDKELREDKVLAWWDFSIDIPTMRIHDRGPLGLHGELFNLPARAVRGSTWSGREMCWRHAPREYAAIHFHDDDLYDCGWETDFVAEIPDTLPSGVYGIRLRCGDAEDIIPIFVRPNSAARPARIAVIFSTFTYLAYANYPRSNFDRAYIDRREAWKAYPHHPAEHPEYGRSTYDQHSDGSGFMFSSLRRPQLLMRPGYFVYVDEKGSGLRHLPADLHLVAWFKAKGIDFDVVTDHDLEVESAAALSDYSLVLTVTHPEYQTGRTLDAIQQYIEEGGNFAYLGGNGFYWRIATNPEIPDAIEIRRGESGARMWETEPGECYHAFDGCYGGLWLKNDRPPQRLVGIGMTAYGEYNASYYRRTEVSRGSTAEWIFRGVSDDIIGDFGLSGSGAAGFELDCVDPELGTSEDAIVLARSEGHSSDYLCVPEKVFNPDYHTREWQQQQVHADITYIPKPDGSFIYSAGSIMFCGSLPANDFSNNVSTILENVVRSCL